MIQKLRSVEGFRVRAYFFLTLGLVLSLGGNLASAHLNGHRPSPIEYGIAAVPPLVVFGMIEILVWTPWPDLLRWSVVQALVAVAVAGPAAVVSYIHLFDVTMDGQHVSASRLAVAALTPLMIDGMLAGSTFALLVPRETTESKPQPEVETSVLGASSLAGAVLSGTGFPEPEMEAPAKPKATRVKPERAIGGRRRFRPQQHPLWASYVADGRNWTVAQMQKELEVWSGEDKGYDAAKAILTRWTKVAM